MNNEFGIPYGLYLRLGRQANLQESAREKKAKQQKDQAEQEQEPEEDKLQIQAQKSPTLAKTDPRLDAPAIGACY